MTSLAARLSAAALAATLVGSAAVPAEAKRVDSSEIKDRTEPLPKRLRGIDVEEQLEKKVPFDAAFLDHEGNGVRLGDYFDGEKPVVITLNYSDCPMLCSLQLNGFLSALEQVELTAGKDYQLLTLAIDPTETPKASAETRERYLKQYGRADADWEFLSGGGTTRVADAIGFSYAYNEARDEWVHPAALVVVTPDGTIARYLYGIEYHPKTVRLSIVEASEGKVGSSLDRLILYCFHFDADEGRYAPVAMNIMRVGGGLTAFALGGFLGVYWRRERRKKRSGDAPSGKPRAGTAS